MTLLISDSDEEQLQHIRERVAKVADGVWEHKSVDYGGLSGEEEIWVDGESWLTIYPDRPEYVVIGIRCFVTTQSIEKTRNNAEFIANSKEDVLFLLKMLENREN